MKRQSVPSAMIFWALLLIMPTSRIHSAQKRTASSGSYSGHLPYGISNARKTTVANQHPRFGEFGCGAFGLAYEGVSRGEEDVG